MSPAVHICVSPCHHSQKRWIYRAHPALHWKVCVGMMSARASRPCANAFVENPDEVQSWRRSDAMKFVHTLSPCEECAQKRGRGGRLLNQPLWMSCLIRHKRDPDHPLPITRRVNRAEVCSDSHSACSLWCCLWRVFVNVPLENMGWHAHQCPSNMTTYFLPQSYL